MLCFPFPFLSRGGGKGTAKVSLPICSSGASVPGDRSGTQVVDPGLCRSAPWHSHAPVLSWRSCPRPPRPHCYLSKLSLPVSSLGSWTLLIRCPLILGLLRSLPHQSPKPSLQPVFSPSSLVSHLASSAQLVWCQLVPLQRYFGLPPAPSRIPCIVSVPALSPSSQLVPASLEPVTLQPEAAPCCPPGLADIFSLPNRGRTGRTLLSLDTHAVSPFPEQRGRSSCQAGPVPGLLLSFISLSAVITFRYF